VQAEASPDSQLSLLLEFSDMLRLSLAGNLKAYEILDARGLTIRGDAVLYGSSPAAYAVNPWETVNYAACHDNETLFDQASGLCYACCKMNGSLLWIYTPATSASHCIWGLQAVLAAAGVHAAAQKRLFSAPLHVFRIC